jgi:hypothetical protein
MMLYQPGNVYVVFKNKDGLAQPVSPLPAAYEEVSVGACRDYEQSNAARQRNCKRLMNLIQKPWPLKAKSAFGAKARLQSKPGFQRLMSTSF